MAKLLWMGSFLVFGSGAMANPENLKAPDFSVNAQAQGKVWVYTATPPAHHHINTAAPMSLESGTGAQKVTAKPTTSTPQKVTFRVPEQKSGSVQISLYLCDEANTYCERHVVGFTPGSGAGAGALNSSSAAKPEEKKSSEPQGPASVPPTFHGFILNDPQRALSQAKREKKPLMIDFFGIWCPPCNELDEKVFSSREFQRASHEFVRLKLDADSAVSWELKAKYHVGGYPTVIFATEQGDEISRIVGYREPKEFAHFVTEAFQERHFALEELEKKAAHGDRLAADRAGVIRYERGEYAKAAKLLAQTKDRSEYFHLAEIEAQESEKTPLVARIQRILQAIQAFPKTPSTVSWYEKLAKLHEEAGNAPARKEALQKAIDLARALSQEPQLLTGYDATPADLLEGLAQDQEELGGPDSARPAWLDAAHAYEKRGLGATERANNLEYAFCQGKAGHFDQARAIYERLEKIYSGEFTFFFNHARLEKEAKNLPQALHLAQRAYELSYGDNRLRVALLVAQLQQSLKETSQAKAFLDEVLKNLMLPEDSSVRTHRYAEALKKFRQTL